MTSTTQLASGFADDLLAIGTALAALHRLRTASADLPWGLGTVAMPNHNPALAKPQRDVPEMPMFIGTRATTPDTNSRHAALAQAAAEVAQTDRISAAAMRIEDRLAIAPLLSPGLRRLEITFPGSSRDQVKVAVNGVSLGPRACGTRRMGQRLAWLATRFAGQGASGPYYPYRVENMPVRAPNPALAVLLRAGLAFPEKDLGAAEILKRATPWEVVEIHPQADWQDTLGDHIADHHPGALPT